MSQIPFAGLAALALVASVSANASQAASQLAITVENLAESGSFSFTPLYLGFHDGNFDAFDVGAPASQGVELIAELGQPGGLPPERTAASPGSQGAVIAQPANGVPTLDPGETATSEVTIADPGLNQYLTFLSMVVPSNDLFFGNDDPLAYRLFSDSGAFLGPLTIDVTAEIFYDAGTEVNDVADGPAFVAGQDGTAGTPEGGTIQIGGNLVGFGGVTTPAGVLDGSLIDFESDRAGFALARITVTDATPIPLPAGAVFGLTGLLALGGVGAMRRRPKV